MPQAELTPSAQHLGYPIVGTSQVYDSPVVVGGGDVADDSDSSYLELGSWTDIATSEHHIETVACDFFFAAGASVSAMYLLLRAKSDDALLADPFTDLTGGAHFWGSLSDVVTETAFFVVEDGLYTFEPFLYDGITEPTEIGGWTNPTPADPADPTYVGHWYQIGIDDEDPGAGVALAGNGLRVTIGIYWPGVDSPRRALVDLYEMRLVVSYAGGLAPPCHLYPRDDDQGAGTAAIWPPPSSQQATGQPGYY